MDKSHSYTGTDICSLIHPHTHTHTHTYTDQYTHAHAHAHTHTNTHTHTHTHTQTRRPLFTHTLAPCWQGQCLEVCLMLLRDSCPERLVAERGVAGMSARERGLAVGTVTHKPP